MADYNCFRDPLFLDVVHDVAHFPNFVS